MRWLLMYLIVVFSAMVISKVGICACREERLPIPILGGVIIQRECTFSSITEFRNAPKPEYGWYLDTNMDKIPETAKDIYYFDDGGPERDTYFSLTLSSEEEAIKVAEEFAGVSISEFKDGIVNRRSIRVSEDTFITDVVIPDHIFEGPAYNNGDKWKTPYWNLKEIKKGKYIERPGWSGYHYIFMDIDTHRVYLCEDER